MARAFRRKRGRFEVGLEGEERALLSQVADEVAELITADLGIGEVHDNVQQAAESDDPLSRLEAEMASSPETVVSPSDPATKRMFPAASVDDEDLSNEFRRLTQRSLAERKIENLRSVVASVDATAATQFDITLSKEQAQQWMTALTDMRLVLADRIGLRNDHDSEALEIFLNLEDQDRGEDDPPTVDLSFMSSLYDFMTWLQEGLMQLMLDEADADTDDSD